MHTLSLHSSRSKSIRGIHTVTVYFNAVTWLNTKISFPVFLFMFIIIIQLRCKMFYCVFLIVLSDVLR